MKKKRLKLSAKEFDISKALAILRIQMNLTQKGAFRK